MNIKLYLLALPTLSNSLSLSVTTMLVIHLNSHTHQMPLKLGQTEARTLALLMLDPNSIISGRTYCLLNNTRKNHVYSQEEILNTNGWLPPNKNNNRIKK